MSANLKPTIFSIMSLSNILLSSGLAVTLFLVVVRPEASLGLNVIERTIFWTLHVGAGILAMFIASHLMQRSNNSVLSVVPSILVCGVIGTVLVAPFYVAVDYLWPTLASQEVDGMLDRLAVSGLPGNIVAEIMEVMPWTLSAWLIVNLPILTDQFGTDSESGIGWDDHVSRRESPENTQPAADNVINGAADTRRVVGVVAEPETMPQPVTSQPAQQFLQSLPGVFGKDIIAVTSDLHYLNVFTLVGKTTILGNLRDVTIELEALGMQVHRSHWVSHEHVVRVVNTGGQAACILSNGLRVPVSRRRWKDVREFYGQGVIQRNSSKTEGSE